jgi:zinc and cadmium transporter
MNPLDISLLVGSALLGGLAGMYLHGRITKDVKVVLAFSGAYLFALAILHLMPEIYLHLAEKAGLYILLGFLLQLILDYFSKGIEHGHLHYSDKVRGVFPLGIYISLFLHSFIEGLPLAGDDMAAMHLHGHGHAHGNHDHGHSDALLIGIAIHKVPEALALAALLYHYYNTKGKTLLMLGLYALATPLGIWAGMTFMQNAGEQAAELYAIMLSIAVGIFIHVSTTIIFEADEHHKFNLKKSVAILLGLALVWVSTAL